MISSGNSIYVLILDFKLISIIFSNAGVPDDKPFTLAYQVSVEKEKNLGIQL